MQSDAGDADCCLVLGYPSRTFAAMVQKFLKGVFFNEFARLRVDEQAYCEEIFPDVVQQLCMVFVGKGNNAPCAEPMAIL